MSRCSKLQKSRVAVGLLIALAVTLISSPAFEQSGSNPKVDVFVGYQWLHPGATVPAPGSDPNSPAPITLADSAKGAGVALTYNFDPHWGAEFDIGYNDGNQNPLFYDTTFSVGPRFIWRTEDANFFLHSLVSYSRVRVDDLDGRNGIGAILGG